MKPGVRSGCKGLCCVTERWSRRQFLEEAVNEPSPGLGCGMNVKQIGGLGIMDVTEPAERPKQARRNLSLDHSRKFEPMDRSAVHHSRAGRSPGRSVTTTVSKDCLRNCRASVSMRNLDAADNRQILRGEYEHFHRTRLARAG